MLFLSIPLIVAFIASLLLTPIVRAVAPKFDIVDRPDTTRKIHQRIIPLGGGIAVLGATLVGVSAAVWLPGEVGAVLRHTYSNFTLLFVVAVLICLLGLADDKHVLRGRQKLVGQMLIVGGLLYSGLVIEKFEILGWYVELGLLALPFTLCWLLGAINSLNLLDGADGFATTVGIIISGTIALMAAMLGHTAEAAVALALMGAQLGFLVFNFPPASIFLGDGGSMLIGLAVGVLAIRSSLKGPATIALAAPLAILAIPFFDSAVAILRRWLTGRSLYTTDHGHLHHSLSRRGLGPRAILVCVALLCAGTASGALVSLYMKNEGFALVSVATVVSILIVSRLFGFSELVLLASRALAFGNSLVASSVNSDSFVHQESVQLHGSRNWDELWRSLVEFAENHKLCDVRLVLSAAWLREDFHAKWHRNRSPADGELWSLLLPIRVFDRTLGRLEIAGCANGELIYPTIREISNLMTELTPCIEDLAKELPTEPLLVVDTPCGDSVFPLPERFTEEAFFHPSRDS